MKDYMPDTICEQQMERRRRAAQLALIQNALMELYRRVKSYDPDSEGIIELIDQAFSLGVEKGSL